MPDQTANSLPDVKKDNGVYMQAGVVDQLNTNQQSNMTLSTGSVITQSYSTVKINNA